ncbi:MAG TPA: class I SAM-dependent methyltransferase [Ktedonobacterales bacterium]|nr:class I SAM-dependent methyltransferase [Ktedonobacterales bacterium]
MIETSSDHDIYSYEAFTRHAFYAAVNHALVERAVAQLDTRPAGERLSVVDLGSGTGAITQMIVDALKKRGRDARVIGVEPSADAIRVAERRLEGAGMDVRFTQGDAGDLARLGIRADALFFCNAIHLVPDKNEVIEKIAAALAPGGLFATNSSFFTGAYAAGSERFYRLWTMQAMRWLRREHPEVKIVRDSHALAMQWLTRDDYAGLLRKHGFRIVQNELDEALMPLESWQDIGSYWLFIEGALPGAPIALGAAALRAAAVQAFEELGLSVVPRNWLQLVGQLEPVQ